MRTVETEVRRCAAAGERFTAWNITSMVRARSVRQSHRVIKEIVDCLHRYGQMGADYERTLIAVGNGSAPAFLYHHAEDDPRDYGNGSGAPSRDSRYDLTALTPAAKWGTLNTLLNRVINR